MISVALKARTRKSCSVVRIIRYVRCRLMGSAERWFWLARIIKGRSQQVRTNKGEDRGSVPM